MTERYESRASTHADDCWGWGPKHYECAVREIKALRAEVEGWKEQHARDSAELLDVQRERDELQQSFDLHWRATMRAIKRWQEAHPGSDLTWPDHADLVVWLLEQLDAARAERDELLAALRNALPVLEFEVKTRGSVDLMYKTPAGPVLDAARAAIAKAEGRSDE